MNFLAHIYLSGSNDLIKLGNFSADGIRGKSFEDYPLAMQVGIKLHRAIDSYTDEHTLFRKSSKRLFSKYSHYARVIVDIYYDHFLAANWSRYSEIPLHTFVQDFYKLANKNLDLLPPKFQELTPYMISGNWLEGYAELKGIASVLNGMDRRTQMKSKMSYAVEDLELHYTSFEEEFTLFFKDLQAYAESELLKLEQLYLQ